jgi:hypothetical protein
LIIIGSVSIFQVPLTATGNLQPVCKVTNGYDLICFDLSAGCCFKVVVAQNEAKHTSSIFVFDRFGSVKSTTFSFHAEVHRKFLKITWIKDRQNDFTGTSGMMLGEELH